MLPLTQTTDIQTLSNTSPVLETNPQLYRDFQDMLYRNGYKPSSSNNNLGQAYYNYPQSTQVNNDTISGNVPVKISETLDDTIKIEPVADTLGVKVNAMDVTMPLLSAMGIGWESYKNNTEFWTDLSYALFDTTFLETGELADKTAVDVLLKAFDDGSIKAYCNKQFGRTVLDRAYDLGAFSDVGTSKPTYEIGEHQILTHGGYDIETAMSLFDKKVKYKTSMPRSTVYNYMYATIPSDSNAFTFREYTDSISRKKYRIIAFKVSDFNNCNVTSLSNQDYFNIQDASGVSFTGWVEVGLDTDGYASSISAHTPVMGIEADYGKLRGSGVLVSTIGSEYNPPYSALRYSPSAKVPTSKETGLNTFTDWLSSVLSFPSIDPTTGESTLSEWLPISIFDSLQNTAQDISDNIQDAFQLGDLTQDFPFELPTWLWDFTIPSINIPNNGTPSENPSGNTPVVVPPSNNNSSKLFTVYNPTAQNLDDLGNYLWSDNIGTLIKELFANNRMDAIISLHQVYCTPSTNGTKHIILGNLDSNVTSLVVNNQYVNIDCGTKYVAELYGDARDYLNVDCQIFLPFIGFRNVDPHDIINCYVKILYTIDVYCGSCLAQIVVTKGTYTQTLYTFEGNCSVQIPLTGSDRARVIGAIASTVTTGIATGSVGAVGMAVGQMASGNAQASIQRTSGFSGNCGAMGIKKPYIVMTRLKSADAVNYNKIVGNPTNKCVYLGNCKGYTRIKEIHLDNITATDQEKEIIYSVLKQGIVL